MGDIKIVPLGILNSIFLSVEKWTCEQWLAVVIERTLNCRNRRHDHHLV